MSTPPHGPWPPVPNGPDARAGVAQDAPVAPGDGDEQPTLIRLRADARMEPLLWSADHATVPDIRGGRMRGPDRGHGTSAAPLIGLVVGLVCVALIVVVVAVVALGQISPAQRPSSVAGPRPVPTATALPTATPSLTPSATATATEVPTGNAAAFVTTDTTTGGNWQDVYGAAGYSVVGDAQQLPAAIQLSGSGAASYVWAASTTDARAPQKATNPADRVAACWYAPTSFSLDVNVTDGQAHQLALYLLDWDQRHRVETVTVLDATNGMLLDASSISGFEGGQYLVWTVRGHVTIRVTNAPGSVNAVVSGVYFS
jgi:hypothetical protein